MANQFSESGTGDYSSILRRRLPWMLLVLVLTAVAGVGYLAVAAKTYQSQASVLVTQSLGLDAGNSSAGRTSAEVNLDTEAQIVKSTPVAAGAAELLRSEVALPELVKDVSVSVPPNTTVLAITFTAGTATGAREGAHAFAQAYIEDRTGRAKDQVASQVDAIKSQITTAEKQLRTVSDVLQGAPPNSPDRATAEAQRTVLLNQIQTLNTRLIPLTTSDVSAATILTDSELPTTPTSPDRLLVLGSALALGLLLALAIALVTDRWDRRVRRPSDVARSGLEVLVTGVDAERSVAIVEARSTQAALYAQVRVSVFSALPSNKGTLLVCSVGAGVGGAVAAANLSASVARTGISTILVSADPMSLAPQLLGARPDDPTLADALEAGAAQFRRAGRGDPSVLPAGAQLPLVADRLHGGSMQDVLRVLRETFDVIVLEVPPLDQDPTALTVGRLSDVAVIVVTDRRTIRSTLGEAVHRLGATGVQLVGAMVLVPGRRRFRKSPPVALTAHNRGSSTGTREPDITKRHIDGGDTSNVRLSR